MIFLGGLSKNGMISEKLAGGIGIFIVLVLVAAGVAITIMNSVSYGKYDWLEVEDFDTEYGVEGIVRKAKESFMPIYTKGLSVGVVLCILSVIPLILAGAVEAEDWIACGCVSLLLLLVGFGVYQIVYVSIIYDGYQNY